MVSVYIGEGDVLTMLRTRPLKRGSPIDLLY